MEPNLGLSEEILTVCAGKDFKQRACLLKSGARREFLGPGAREGANPYGTLKRGKPKSGHARAVSQQPEVRGQGFKPPGLQQGKVGMDENTFEGAKKEKGRRSDRPFPLASPLESSKCPGRVQKKRPAR